MLALGFYGALRGSEYTAVGDINGTIRAPVLSQLQFIQFQSSYGLTFTMYTTKTTSQPIVKHIGCSKHSVCAVCNMVSYLQFKGTTTGLHPKAYLFTDSTGQPVTKGQLNTIIKSAVSKLGLPAAGFSTHSLRAGSATSASQAGFADHEIKTLGHWASDTYNRYIHKSTQEQFTYASRIANNHT